MALVTPEWRSHNNVADLSSCVPADGLNKTALKLGLQYPNVMHALLLGNATFDYECDAREAFV